jgi:hypothetical protein
LGLASPLAVFIYDMIWLGILGLIAGLYATGTIPSVSSHNAVTSLMPISVPWFGAVGATVISLYGVFFHGDDWHPRWAYWHYGRPFVGAIFAVVAAMIFLGVLRAAVDKSANLTSSSEVYVLDTLAFLVGYRERTFRELLKRFADLILAPGGVAAGSSSRPPRPHLTVSPKTGPAPLDVQVTLDELGGRAAATDYTLEFGDGAQQGGSSFPTSAVMHTFTVAGRYRVRLICTTASGTKGHAWAEVDVQ